MENISRFTKTAARQEDKTDSKQGQSAASPRVLTGDAIPPNLPSQSNHKRKDEASHEVPRDSQGNLRDKQAKAQAPDRPQAPAGGSINLNGDWVDVVDRELGLTPAHASSSSSSSSSPAVKAVDAERLRKVIRAWLCQRTGEIDPKRVRIGGESLHRVQAWPDDVQQAVLGALGRALGSGKLAAFALDSGIVDRQNARGDITARTVQRLVPYLGIHPPLPSKAGRLADDRLGLVTLMLMYPHASHGPLWTGLFQGLQDAGKAEDIVTLIDKVLRAPEDKELCRSLDDRKITPDQRCDIAGVLEYVVIGCGGKKMKEDLLERVVRNLLTVLFERMGLVKAQGVLLRLCQALAKEGWNPKHQDVLRGQLSVMTGKGSHWLYGAMLAPGLHLPLRGAAALERGLASPLPEPAAGERRADLIDSRLWGLLLQVAPSERAAALASAMPRLLTQLASLPPSEAKLVLEAITSTSLWDVVPVDEAIVRLMGRTVGQGLADPHMGEPIASDTVRSLMQQCLRKGVPERVSPFIESLIAGMGGSAMPAALARQVVTTLSALAGEPTAWTGWPAMIEAVRRAMGAAYDQAMADTTRAWDLPAQPEAPVERKSDSKSAMVVLQPGAQIDQLLGEIGRLGPVELQRPPLPRISAQEREVARLGLQIRRINLTLNELVPDEGDRGRMRDSVRAAARQLRRYIRQDEPESSDPETAATAMRTFQARYGAGMTVDDWLHDTIALGCRMGWHATGEQLNERQRRVIGERVDRLGSLASGGALLPSTHDPVLIGLMLVMELGQGPLNLPLRSALILDLALASIGGSWTREQQLQVFRCLADALASTAPHVRRVGWLPDLFSRGWARGDWRWMANPELVRACARAYVQTLNVQHDPLHVGRVLRNFVGVEGLLRSRARVVAYASGLAGDIADKTDLLKQLADEQDPHGLRQSLVLGVCRSAGPDDVHALLKSVRHLPLATVSKLMSLRATDPAMDLRERTWTQRIAGHLAAQPLAHGQAFPGPELTTAEVRRLAMALALGSGWLDHPPNLLGAVRGYFAQASAIEAVAEGSTDTAPLPLPPVSPERLAACREALRIIQSPGLVLDVTAMGEDERMKLLEELCRHPEYQTPVRASAALNSVFESKAPPLLKLRAASEVMFHTGSLMRLATLRQMRVMMIHEIHALLLQETSAPPGRPGKVETKAGHGHIAGALEQEAAEVDATMALTQACSYLAAACEQFSALPAIAWLYPRESDADMDTGTDTRPTLDLERVRDEEDSLREHLDFLDEEILQSTRVQVPAMVRDHLLSLFAHQREPLVHALEMLNLARGPRKEGKA